MFDDWLRAMIIIIINYIISTYSIAAEKIVIQKFLNKLLKRNVLKSKTEELLSGQAYYAVILA